MVLPAISFCHPDWCTSWPHISRSQHVRATSPPGLSLQLVTFPHQSEPCHSFPWMWPNFIATMNFSSDLPLNYKSNTQPSHKYLCLSDNRNGRLYPAFVIQSEEKTSCTQSILLHLPLNLYWPATCFRRAALEALHYVDGFAIRSFNRYIEGLVCQALFKQLFTVNLAQLLCHGIYIPVQSQVGVRKANRLPKKLISISL